MKTIKLSNACSQYGANMGRLDQPVTGRCHLQRIRFVDGDYDNGGAYWGGGRGTTPLYVCQDANLNQCFVRAKSRGHAKEQVKEKFGNKITFYN